MEIRYYHVDAFTHQPFKGNAAGVCLLPDALPDETLQNIAAENNLANTAFVWREKEQYKLRWFTPKVEVALCGHATLAASHVLWSEGLADAHETLRFQTLSGILEVQKLPNGFLEMNFPAYANKPIDLPSTLREALPATIINTVFAVDRYVVELSSEAEVRNLKPDFEKLKEYLCVVTAKGRKGTKYDFVSRYFAVPVGVAEDPVTGSAHCCLAPYWAEQLKKTDFIAYQASSRGGELLVGLAGDRVHIAGQAITFSKGVIRLPVD